MFTPLEPPGTLTAVVDPLLILRESLPERFLRILRVEVPASFTVSAVSMGAGITGGGAAAADATALGTLGALNKHMIKGEG